MSPGDHSAERLTALITRARALTLRLIHAAERTLARGSLSPLPEIRFDLRGLSAGQFRVDHQGHCIIRYSPALLLRHDDDFLRRTVPHETAHFLVYRLYRHRVRPHGPEWQAVMRHLGADPERCHDYDVAGLAARRTRYYLYHCDCNEHRLSSIRHNKVQRGVGYSCRRCGGPLRPGASPADGG
jgi:SprT protein